MTEQLRQSLSAVIDGEADAFELRRVLDELDRDPELRAAWDRYHLVGSVIRGERTPESRTLARTLASRVPLAVRQSVPGAGTVAQAASGDGAVAGAPREAAPGRVRRAVLGAALAASIALVAVVGFNVVDSVTTPATAPEVALAAGNPQRVFDDVPIRPSPPAGQRRLIEASPSDLRRAHAYMLQHAQQQGLDQRGVMSLVKMATYEAP
jgi:sigma-E factor negative regulatory protein RseA